jgi:hypothetical protein
MSLKDINKAKKDLESAQRLKENIDWNTGEAFLWLQNDESLYLRAKQCKTPKSLQTMWSMHAPKRMLNSRYVDWKQVFEDIKEE